MVRVRPGLVALVSAVLVALLFPAAHAVDPATFACEDKGIDALRKFADRRVACLERCWRAQIRGGTGRVCVDDADPDTPPTLDAKTLACVQKTETRYVSAVEAVCPASAYPACGTYPPNVQDHAARELRSNAPLIDASTVPSILCDPAQAKCEQRIVPLVEHLQKDVQACFSACASALHLQGDTSRQCVPLHADLTVLDGLTQGCIANARTKFLLSVARACAALPTCGLYAQGAAGIADFELQYFAVGASVADVGPYCASPSGAFVDR